MKLIDFQGFFFNYEDTFCDNPWNVDVRNKTMFSYNYVMYLEKCQTSEHTFVVANRDFINGSNSTDPLPRYNVEGKIVF